MISGWSEKYFIWTFPHIFSQIPLVHKDILDNLPYTASLSIDLETKLKKKIAICSFCNYEIRLYCVEDDDPYSKIT